MPTEGGLNLLSLTLFLPSLPHLLERKCINNWDRETKEVVHLLQIACLPCVAKAFGSLRTMFHNMASEVLLRSSISDCGQLNREAEVLCAYSSKYVIDLPSGVKINFAT